MSPVQDSLPQQALTLTSVQGPLPQQALAEL
jgi:hypothetical protein